jgi:hypothetical protein
MAAARAEVFHGIAESDSAAARRPRRELGLLDRLELRNVDPRCFRRPRRHREAGDRGRLAHAEIELWRPTPGSPI